MRLRDFQSLALALCVSGCAMSAGEPSGGFLNPSLAAAYLPLDGTVNAVLDAHGAATVIAPGVAATNAHNADVVSTNDVIGISRDYDLLFFHTSSGPAAPEAKPWIGEMVIAYGQGTENELREARGVVRSLDTPVRAMCPGCPIQRVLTFEANAGQGFSGGPVADSTTGQVVGIVFGYNDMKDGSRLMYAYDMSRVQSEYAKAREKPAQTAAREP
jgi:hypothetical protein